MATAGELHGLYSLRLNMNDEGLTTRTPALRTAVGSLIEKLEARCPSEVVQIDARPDPNPISRFVGATASELLGEIPHWLFDGSDIH